MQEVGVQLIGAFLPPWTIREEVVDCWAQDRADLIAIPIQIPLILHLSFSVNDLKIGSVTIANKSVGCRRARHRGVELKRVQDALDCGDLGLVHVPAARGGQIEQGVTAGNAHQNLANGVGSVGLSGEFKLMVDIGTRRLLKCSRQCANLCAQQLSVELHLHPQQALEQMSESVQ